MAFHLEIRRNFHRAWAFNMSAEELARTVLDQWRRNATVDLGGREWKPADCGLTVLEGPQLDGPDLAYGRGWGSAQRSGTDVTARILASRSAVRVAVLAQLPEGIVVARALLGELGLEESAWGALRARLLSPGALPGAGAAESGVAGVLLLCAAGPAPAAWVFDAGLALGAFGGSAVVLAPAEVEVDPVFGSADVVRLSSQPGPAAEAIARRLSAAIAPGGIGSG